MRGLSGTLINCTGRVLCIHSFLNFMYRLFLYTTGIMSMGQILVVMLTKLATVAKLKEVNLWHKLKKVWALLHKSLLA